MPSGAAPEDRPFAAAVHRWPRPTFSRASQRANDPPARV
ncbi:protein of unassigned function [Methylobacterium oryzae CBMB20]|uniref:Protein of unassigned function n=1 Tax=Methylobacterium oryzae CBMB20 TaxID=693986 RepID=A0A089P076_9HYPH|nr:protein of unassigned function [Methylobacterium oryzae CBMB20]